MHFPIPWCTLDASSRVIRSVTPKGRKWNFWQALTSEMSPNPASGKAQGPKPQDPTRCGVENCTPWSEVPVALHLGLFCI